MPHGTYEKKARFAFLAVVLLVVTGTAGYRIIEGWPWFECFYMTIITLATIGYTEPAGITEQGRYFTATLIILGVWTVGYSVAVLTHIVIQGEIAGKWERRRVDD